MSTSTQYVGANSLRRSDKALATSILLNPDPALSVVLSFPHVGRVESILLTLYKLRSGIVNHGALVQPVDWDLVVNHLVPPNRALRLVLSRKPVPFMPHASEPKCLLVYVVETLECGHELTVYPQCDPLIAKRRICPDCAALPHAKKPAQSVRPEAERKIS
jgi:hypothetical protein